MAAGPIAERNQGNNNNDSNNKNLVRLMGCFKKFCKFLDCSVESETFLIRNSTDHVSQRLKTINGTQVISIFIVQKFDL